MASRAAPDKGTPAMALDHHFALLLSYGTALTLWLILGRLAPRLWPATEPPKFQRPWLEVGFTLSAAVGVIALGQLYLAGFQLPTDGAFGPFFEALNQLLIFSPMPLLLLIRRQPLSTAWLPTTQIGPRIAVGVGLALGATLVFSLTRGGADSFLAIAPRLVGPSQIQHVTQVFCEDLAIAILLCRLSAAMPRPMLAAWGVAGLFALGHMPALLQNAADWRDLAYLVADFALAGAALSIVQRSRDIWWFFCVHYAMDMMQFQRVSGVAFSGG